MDKLRDVFDYKYPLFVAGFTMFMMARLVWG